MSNGRTKRYLLLALVLTWMSGSISGQQIKNGDNLRPTQMPEAIGRAVDLMDEYTVTPDVEYIQANSYAAKVDIYQKAGPGPKATLVYIHGGGWGPNEPKDKFSLWFEPFLLLGWNVVNVEYRSSDISLAPAAVEDCLCALRWTIHNAKQYSFDTNQIVLMGHSAGGHLALMTGMTPESAGLDRECPGPEVLKAAAIIDWSGITDVAELLDGANQKGYAVKWLGSLPNRTEVARRVSPLTYVRSGLPPIIIIHGDKDPTVPYSQALRLESALKNAGIPSELVTIPGGRHVRFEIDQTRRVYMEIFDFLRRNGISPTFLP